MRGSPYSICPKAVAVRRLVDAAVVGICGSDLHYYNDGGIGSAIIHQQFAPGSSVG
jgi:L-iditol 2-dehydrogenase